jgi:hypothetical protein
MSEKDREFAVQLTDYLDSVIERAAAEAGVFYVDTRHALDGHKLCESGEKAVNGLTEGDDSILRIANESYHPNKMGQQLLASTIALQTDCLTKPMPASRIIPAMNLDDIELLKGMPHAAPNPPKRIWVELDGGQLMFTGRDMSVNISENDTQRILRNGTVMRAELHSLPVDVGGLTVDANGALGGTLHIPSGLPVGFHTLHVYGQDKYFQDVDVQLSVYVAASPDDYDGDGIPNAEDSCVAVPPSGKDEDHDSIDDACDPVIYEAPAADDGQGGTPGSTDDDAEEPAESEAEQKHNEYVLSHLGDYPPVSLIPAQSRKLFGMLVKEHAIAMGPQGKGANDPLKKPTRPNTSFAMAQTKTAAKGAKAKTYWLPAAIIVAGASVAVVVLPTSRRR